MPVIVLQRDWDAALGLDAAASGSPADIAKALRDLLTH
jgi:hypothetical protein